MRLLSLSVFFLASLIEVSSSTVPLILWSPVGYFPSHSIESSESKLTSADALKGLFDPLLTTGKRVPTPEFVIAFLLPEFSSAELSHAFGGFSEEHSANSAYSFIKDTLAESASSLTVLHSMPLSEHPLINLVQSAEPMAHTLRADCNNAISELNHQKSLIGNSRTDLLLVSIDSAKQAETCVKSVLSAAEGTNYLALLSAKQAHTVRRNFGSNVNAPLSTNAALLAFSQSAAAHNSFDTSATSSGSDAPDPYSPYGPQKHPDFPKSYITGQAFLRPGPLYINPSITIGLMVGLFLLISLLIGLCCITDIERPVRMTNTPLQIPKEY